MSICRAYSFFFGGGGGGFPFAPLGGYSFVWLFAVSVLVGGW